jgi:hypothetical protein
MFMQWLESLVVSGPSRWSLRIRLWINVSVYSRVVAAFCRTSLSLAHGIPLPWIYQ